MNQSTTDQILQALEPYNLKHEDENQYRCNRPWSPGSNSMGLSLTIDDPEHGAWYDHVADEGGSLYELAERLGIDTKNGNKPTEETSAAYNDLVAYARAHGVDAEVFRAAGWKEERYPYDGRDRLRRALRFPTRNGDRWRFLDGYKPKFKSPKDYKPCWYGLARAVEIANRTDQPLVICNGEPSVVAAQHYEVAACALTSGEKKDIPFDLLDELQSAWNGEIIIAPDCDDTGEKMAAGWLAKLQEAGYQVSAVDLNGGKGFDLADFCALHNENSAQQMQALKLLFSGAQEPKLPEGPSNFEDDIDYTIQADNDRFTIHWAAEAYDKPPPTDFIVDGLITAGSVNLVVGEGGSKKTWAMIDLGVAISRGESWLDFSTHKGIVLFVDEESGPMRFRRRLHEALRGRFAGPETPFAFISLAQLNLRSIDDVNALHVLIEQTGAQIVMIDALADVMPGGDENAVKDVQPIFLALRKVSEITRAAIVIIHHANKAGGYRGSTALKGAVDLMLMVESKPKSPHISFKVEKARDIEPLEFNGIANFANESGQFWLSPGEKTLETAKMGKAQEYVLRFLAENGSELLTEIMNHADTCSPNSARLAVYNLTGAGYAARVDDGGPGEKATYDLTDKGREYVGRL